MQVIHFQEEPEPLFLMPYYPLGNIEEISNIKYPQYVSACRQILLDFRHLHGRRVIHRDFKPENLLVATLHPFTVVISDFGLSKLVAGNDFTKIFCGSRLYAAPDIVLDKHSDGGYGHLVDIWSAGAVMLEFIFSRPNHTRIDRLPLEAWIKAFSNIVVERVAELDENNDQVIDILKNMLTINPKVRFTAEQCLQKGCNNGFFRRLSNGQIIDGNEGPENDANEVALNTDTGIAVLGAEVEDNGSERDITTPRQQSPKQSPEKTEIKTENVTKASVK